MSGPITSPRERVIPAARWRILGDETVSVDGQPVALQVRPRSVLVRLLVDVNRPVATDVLIESLWGDTPPKSAKNSVARFIADLRRALGPMRERIVSVPNGYMVEVGGDELDIDRVQSTLQRARALEDPGETELREVADALAEARTEAGTTGNSYLAGLTDSTIVERQHDELRAALLEVFVDVKMALGEHREVVADLAGAIAADPYDETFWRQSMVVLDATGRPTEALRAAQRLRDLLTEIGVAPSTAITDIERTILDRTGGEQPTTEHEPGPAPHAIPDPGTTLVGRIDALRDLQRVVEAHRLVSIVGVGGTGKTRLAVALAHAKRAAGVTVYDVALDSVTDPELILPTIAAAIGVSPAACSDATALARAIGAEPFLLVLDNCEHLLDACADVVENLLEFAPGVRILATTRVALDVKGERLYNAATLATVADPVTPLPAAVKLFVDRAGPSLDEDLTPTDVEHVRVICQALAGLPLAIEVAAAQLAYMTLDELLERITSPRIGSTGGSSRPEEPPVAALADVLAWSWEMLDPAQQMLLARMSVFAGTGTREAIDAVARVGERLGDDLERLIRAGLVRVADSEEQPRFGVLAPIREFASVRLDERGETIAMRDRLTAWLFAHFGRYHYSERNVWSHVSAELLPDLDNLVVALTHLRAQHRNEELAELAMCALGVWTNHRYPGEAVRWLSPIIEDVTLPAEIRSGAAASAMMGYHTLGDLEQMASAGTVAFELGKGQAHDWMPGLAGYFSKWSLVAETPYSTDEYSEMSFELAARTPSGDTNVAIAAMYRADVEFMTRRYEDALANYRLARALTEYQGRLLMLVEIGESLSLYLSGRREEAARTVRAWVSRSDTDHWHYSVDVFRAVILGGAGEPDRATAELAEAVRRMPQAMVWGQADIVQTTFALLADFRGEPDLATQLFETANNRDLVMVAVTVEHLLEQRGLEGDEAWFEIASELWSRVVPEHRLTKGFTTPQLLAWWTEGHAA